jgi:hypothetical protein
MSRSDYTDDDEDGRLAMWRGAVMSSIRGKRGQKLLRDLLAAFDAMPVKELIAEELVTSNGSVCALGALGVARGLDLKDIDPEDYTRVAQAFDIAEPLAREIEYMNDEGHWGAFEETPAERWKRMRKWVAAQIKPTGDKP